MIKHITLTLSLLCTGLAFAQIPNASFETWTHHTGGGSAGYDTPDSWGNINSLTSFDSTYTCTKGTTGAPSGSAYIKLTSQTVPIVGAVPGIAVTGTISLSGTTPSVSGGFANATRYANLTGQWQYMAMGADQGHIAVFLSKWNSALNKRDTVSFTNYSLSGMVMSWTAFSIPLTYQKGSIPDTAMIVLSSSGTTPVANSYLYVDALAFTGTVPTGVVTVVNDRAATTIFPNPAKDKSTIYYYSLFAGQLQINITDISGKIIRTSSARIINGSNDISLDLTGLIKGVYMVNLTDGIGTESKKIVVE